MSYCNLIYHLVFSTKNREPNIGLDLEPDLHAFLGGIIKDLQGKPIRINGTFDHVHLLLYSHQSIAIADLLGHVKSRSSRWVNKEHRCRGHFAWQIKYGAFTVSPSELDKTIRYIENQKEHHRKKTFQEEFREFLEAHEIEYDERYIWE